MDFGISILVFAMKLKLVESSSAESEFDDSGFDKHARINFEFKEGINFNSFISNNVVQDFGKIESSKMYRSYFNTYDRFYVRFDENIDVSFIKPGLWGPFTHIIYPVCMHKHIL